MWKHRAFAKAIIRQGHYKLSHADKMVLLMIADHCNEETDQTYFSIRRLADMVQGSNDTVRKAIKKLEGHSIISCWYTDGKTPVFNMPIPKDYVPSSDTDLKTHLGKIMDPEERAAEAMRHALDLIQVSVEDYSMSVFMGLDENGPAAALEKARAHIARYDSPSKAVIALLSDNFRGQSGKIGGAIEEIEHREKVAREDSLAQWERPRIGESTLAWNARVKMGRDKYEDARAVIRKTKHNPRGA